MLSCVCAMGLAAAVLFLATVNRPVTAHIQLCVSLVFRDRNSNTRGRIKPILGPVQSLAAPMWAGCPVQLLESILLPPRSG